VSSSAEEDDTRASCPVPLVSDVEPRDFGVGEE
jgi:hypothetical protein